MPRWLDQARSRRAGRAAPEARAGGGRGGVLVRREVSGGVREARGGGAGDVPQVRWAV